MAQPRNKAVIAGLAAALTLGGVTLPAVATTSNTTASDSDPNGMGTPLPSTYDKSDYYEGAEGVSTFATTRSASSLAPVALTDEMKYFTLYESGRNYDKGLSSGDGYNAVGYYQFDRRYALVPFLRQVYAYNPETYGMFAPVLAQADTLSSSSYSMYDYNTRQLTALAQQLNAAWHAAYAANPAEFSALQDSYAYNNYYLPVQSMLLNKYGVDLRNRADCVKGLAWSMCNLFGQGGVQKFFAAANLSNSMTDREVVTALCDTVINRVAEWYPNQPQYHAGWQNRFRKEKATCLNYIAQHEAEQNNGNAQEDVPNTDGSGAGGSTTDTPNTDDSDATTPDSNGSNSGNSNEADSGGQGSGNQGSGNQGSGNQGSGSTGDDADAGTPGGGTSGNESTGGDVNGGNSSGGSSSGGSNTDSNSDAGSGSNGAAGNGTQEGSGNDSDANGSGSSSGDASGSQGGSDSGATGGSGSAGGTTGNGASSSGSGQGSDQTTNGDKNTGSTGSEETNKDSTKGDGDGAGNTGNDNSTSDTDKAKDGGKTKKPQDTGTKSTASGLPLTGDDAALVMTGAAGLAIAGASFLSLAKKEHEAE